MKKLLLLSIASLALTSCEIETTHHAPDLQSADMHTRIAANGDRFRRYRLISQL